MICANCGTDNRIGAKFCMECATPLAAVCPSCGTANPAGAKFCSNCATPLTTAGVANGSASPAPASAVAGPAGAAGGEGAEPIAERRLVSVLFADLVGFTPFSEGRDSEEVRETLTRYFDIATEVVARYGGVIEKFIGDAVMAVWGTPTAHEDDAERSVRAALDLVDAVRVLGSGIQARAGVLTGEAAVTIGATNQGMVAGDIVNTAARLQSAAAPGTVLVGEATHRAASSAIAFEPAGEQALKGKASPVPAFRALRVVAERGGRGRSDALEAPFVGRDDELRLIKDLFNATVREGRTRLVSITGIGGIGKSRLAWELEKYLDGIVDAVWWHRGRSPAYGEGITFWALGEMVRARAHLAETDDEAKTRARIGEMLRQHVPDESDRQWIEPALLSLLGIETGVAAEQLFGAWRTFFERLAVSAPVVLIFEDLHWADAGTLEFIEHLLEWSRSAPILIVTLARPELLSGRPDWGAGKRSFSSIHLEPLPLDAMHQLLGGLVPGLPTEARDAIAARADGIPLYAVETVRMLLSQARLILEDGVYRPAGSLDDLAVPETLTALISARLDELGPADRGLVADAAVLGQSFTLAGLAAVSGVDATDLEGRLVDLVRRELLIRSIDPRSPERGQYAFVQGLIREVAYNTLARRDRKVRHLAAARFFESLETDELAGALAGHYLSAYGYAADAEAEALAAQARIALRGAAERAAALGSHGQAITLLERALEVSRDPGDRADLHERALASASRGLVAEIAERHARGALDARRELGEREGIALATATLAGTLLQFDGKTDRAMAILEPAWEEFQDLERTAAGVALMWELARAHTVRDDRVVLAWLERLLPVAERLELTLEVARALHTMGSALYRLDRPRHGLILLRGTHHLAVTNGYEEVDRNARTALTFYEQFDDPAAGLAMAREGLEIARRRGSQNYGFQMVGNAASCGIRIGEWAWSKALLDEWLESEITAPFYLELYVQRAIIATLQGGDPEADLAQADALVGQLEDTQFQSYCHLGRAWAALTHDNLEAAARSARWAAEVTPYFIPIGLPLAGRAALWARDLDGAITATSEIATTISRGRAAALDLMNLRAGIAALEGRRGDAIAAYREAARGWHGLGTAFDEALTGLDIAVLLAPTAREMPDAGAIIDTARATLTRLGARPFLDASSGLPQRGERSPRTRPRSRSRPWSDRRRQTCRSGAAPVSAGRRTLGRSAPPAEARLEALGRRGVVDRLPLPDQEAVLALARGIVEIDPGRERAVDEDRFAGLGGGLVGPVVGDRGVGQRHEEVATRQDDGRRGRRELGGRARRQMEPPGHDEAGHPDPGLVAAGPAPPALAATPARDEDGRDRADIEGDVRDHRRTTDAEILNLGVADDHACDRVEHVAEAIVGERNRAMDAVLVGEGGELDRHECHGAAGRACRERPVGPIRQREPRTRRAAASQRS